MREILFKAKQKRTGKWIYGIPDCDFNYLFDSNSFDSPDCFEIDSETLCQYTGKADKNGRMIFEGDVDTNFDVVTWCENRLGWSLSVYDFTTKQQIECHCYCCNGDFDFNESTFEIIGNIYDNE